MFDIPACLGIALNTMVEHGPPEHSFLCPIVNFQSAMTQAFLHLVCLLHLHGGAGLLCVPSDLCLSVVRSHLSHCFKTLSALLCIFIAGLGGHSSSLTSFSEANVFTKHSVAPSVLLSQLSSLAVHAPEQVQTC